MTRSRRYFAGFECGTKRKRAATSRCAAPPAAFRTRHGRQLARLHSPGRKESVQGAKNHGGRQRGGHMSLRHDHCSRDRLGGDGSWRRWDRTVSCRTGAASDGPDAPDAVGHELGLQPLDFLDSPQGKGTVSAMKTMETHEAKGGVVTSAEKLRCSELIFATRFALPAAPRDLVIRCRRRSNASGRSKGREAKVTGAAGADVKAHEVYTPVSPTRLIDGAQAEDLVWC